MSRDRPRRSPVALLLMVLLAAGCSPGTDDSPGPDAGASTGASGNDAGEGRPRAPARGACYRLRHRDALAPVAHRAPVPCRRKHTSVTFQVGRLDLRPGKRRLRVDSRRVQRQVAEACPRRLRDFLGGTEEERRLSLLTTVWFTPSVEEVTRGARWFRCDVVAPGPDRSLLPLPPPDRLRGLLEDPVRRDGLATCGTAEPGTPAFQRVACARRHSWRAVASVDLGTGPYPAAADVAQRMADPCTAAARERADDPLDFSWTEERPTREQWRAGRRHGLCWTQVPD
jgi:hypothetical protein